jgi:hypothetical protein
VVTRAVKEVTTTRRVQVEEDTRDNDDLLLKTGLEEVETVGDRTRETLQVEPEVEGAVGYVLENETHIAEALDDVVTFFLLSKAIRLGDDGILHGWIRYLYLL